MSLTLKFCKGIPRWHSRTADREKQWAKKKVKREEEGEMARQREQAGDEESEWGEMQRWRDNASKQERKRARRRGREGVTGEEAREEESEWGEIQRKMKLRSTRMQSFGDGRNRRRHC